MGLEIATLSESYRLAQVGKDAERFPVSVMLDSKTGKISALQTLK